MLWQNLLEVTEAMQRVQVNTQKLKERTEIYSPESYTKIQVFHPQHKTQLRRKKRAFQVNVQTSDPKNTEYRPKYYR